MPFPPIHITQPEVYIIESLTQENEEKGLFEGRALYETLAMAGKKPIYKYFRTLEELELLALMYRESGYRYLHVSCHGDMNNIHTTLGSCSYHAFSTIFEGLLKNRRLFMSACETGSEIFSEIVASNNKGMYSIAAPIDSIRFDQAYAIWTAFYTKAYLIDQAKMKKPYMYSALQKLCRLFDVRFHWSNYDAPRDRWIHRELS